MSTKYLSTDLESFNQLFGILAHQKNNICWIRNIEYNKQLYVSPTYESIFGQPIATLLEHPKSFNDSVLPEDRDAVKVSTQQRTDKNLVNVNSNDLFYRILTPSGTTRYLRDISFTICSHLGEPIAIGGISEDISAESWHIAIDTSHPSHSLPGNVDLKTILEAEASQRGIKTVKDQGKLVKEVSRVTCISVNNLIVELSRREADALYHLRQGHSAKKTGDLLFISPRTVESHIENIKQKACVNTKLELMSQLIPINSDGQKR